MVIDRLPQLDLEAEAEQALGIEGRRLDRGAAPGGAQPFAPGRLEDELVQQLESALAAVVRHLHRERALGREKAREPLEQLPVLRKPLQRRVRDDAVEGGLRLPAREIRAQEAKPGLRRALGRAREHLLRVIDAPDGRLGPALEQRARELAGAAAEIGDAPHRAVRHAPEQIEERARALAAEALVLRRVPAVARGRRVAHAAVPRPSGVTRQTVRVARPG